MKRTYEKFPLHSDGRRPFSPWNFDNLAVRRSSRELARVSSFPNESTLPLDLISTGTPRNRASTVRVTALTIDVIDSIRVIRLIIYPVYKRRVNEVSGY